MLKLLGSHIGEENHLSSLVSHTDAHVKAAVEDIQE